jgi:hypothetical protein
MSEAAAPDGEPWARLKPGDGFVVKSMSGNSYALVLIATGERHAGLYVRFKETGKLARFYPEMLDWTTFELGEPQPVLIPRCEVLIAVSAGVEHRGEVLEADADRIVIRLRMSGTPVSILTKEVLELKLLFWATDWRAGDAFLVESRSGREYRGVALNVLADKVEALIQPRFGASDGQRAALRIGHLAMRTFRVLITIPKECLSSSRAQAGATS